MPNASDVAVVEPGGTIFDPVLTEVRRRSVSGAVSRALAQGWRLLLTIGSTVVLARLLGAHEFGLVALGMTILSVLQIFRDAGLPIATIQRENITHAQVSNLFWINVGVSSAVACAMAFAAPSVATFFHEPQLTRVCLALSLVLVLNGLTAQHTALLNRRMEFVTVSVIDAGSFGAGVTVGIVAALMQWGHWSLVAMTLTTTVVAMVSTWAASPWRPQFPRRNAGTRPLLAFGAELTLVGVVYSASRSIDNLLIGRYFGPEAVGLYSRGTALVTRPLDLAIAPIYSIAVPLLSRLQTDRDAYRRVFFGIFETLAICGFFFVGLFLPSADALTVVVMGAPWRAAAPIFASLSVAAIYLPLWWASSWLYASQGRGRDMVYATIIGAILTLAAFAVGLRFGPTGVAVAYSAAGVLLQLPSMFYIAGRAGPVRTCELWVAGTRHVSVLFVVLAATAMVNAVATGGSSAARLVTSTMCGLIAGAGWICVWPPTRAVVKQALTSARFSITIAKEGARSCGS